MRRNAIFRIPTVREFYSKARFVVLIKTRGLRSHGDLTRVGKTDYSGSHFKKHVSIPDRINFLVSVVGAARRVVNSDNLLSLGPRFESELFGYRALGYQKKQIHALDTFSYSKLITMGNMHKMDYPDNFFDVVVGGWIIAYSADPVIAMQEIFRVTKSGGLAILTWDLPKEMDNHSENLDDLVLQSVNDQIHPISEIAAKWESHSFFIGRTSWSKEIRIAVVVLQKPIHI
jgi:hypothetical protein